MAILDELKKYYKQLPAQLTIVNKKAAQIAYEIYKAAVENNTFADHEAFNAEYGNKLEKYVLHILNLSLFYYSNRINNWLIFF